MPCQRRVAVVFHFSCLVAGLLFYLPTRGFVGLVTRNRANKITFLDDGRVLAESGAIVDDLIEQSKDRGLSGFEHFVISRAIRREGAMWQNLQFLSPDRKRTVFIEEIVQTVSHIHRRWAVCTVGSITFSLATIRVVLQVRKGYCAWMLRSNSVQSRRKKFFR